MKGKIQLKEDLNEQNGNTAQPRRKPLKGNPK